EAASSRRVASRSEWRAPSEASLDVPRPIGETPIPPMVVDSMVFPCSGALLLNMVGRPGDQTRQPLLPSGLAALALADADSRRGASAGGGPQSPGKSGS